MAPRSAPWESKERHLMRAAREYARRAGVSWERVRFDLVSIVFTHPPTLSHTRGVFQV